MAAIPCSYINLTPHEVVVTTYLGQRLAIQPEQEPLRVETRNRVAGHTIEYIPIHASEPDEGSISDALDRLKEERARVPHGTLFIIISGLALDILAPHMDDHTHTYTVCPDTGPHSAIRDKDGRIVAVKAFRLGRRP